jgi:hypothetical protein
MLCEDRDMAGHPSNEELAALLAALEKELSEIRLRLEAVELAVDALANAAEPVQAPEDIVSVMLKRDA